MTKNKSLYLLYATKLSKGVSLELIDILTIEGFVADEVIDETLNSELFDDETNKLHFKTLEKLGFFGLELCKSLNLHQCFLLSVEEFNKAIGSSLTKKEQFESLFEDFGTKVELSEDQRNKSFFGRIFS